MAINLIEKEIPFCLRIRSFLLLTTTNKTSDKHSPKANPDWFHIGVGQPFRHFSFGSIVCSL